MIQELQKIFHSITKSLEILYVLEDAKPCARILVFEDEKDKNRAIPQNKFFARSFLGFQGSEQNTGSEFYSQQICKNT